MRTEILKNKAGEELKTKEGILMYRNYLEEGDEFIPQRNNVLEQTREVEVTEKGKQVKKTLTNYSILVQIQKKDGEIIKQEGKTEIFLELTQTQANSLKKKKEEGIDISQHVFRAYTYSNKYGEQIGVGIKGEYSKPLTFEELRQRKEGEELEDN